MRAIFDSGGVPEAQQGLAGILIEFAAGARADVDWADRFDPG